MKWNSISGGFVKKSVPNFHFTEFPFLNEMFSEIHPEFPFSQSGSLETICKAFGPCWGQFVVFSNFSCDFQNSSFKFAFFNSEVRF